MLIFLLKADTCESLKIKLLYTRAHSDEDNHETYGNQHADMLSNLGVTGRYEPCRVRLHISKIREHLQHTYDFDHQMEWVKLTRSEIASSEVYGKNSIETGRTL